MKKIKLRRPPDKIKQKSQRYRWKLEKKTRMYINAPSTQACRNTLRLVKMILKWLMKTRMTMRKSTLKKEHHLITIVQLWKGNHSCSRIWWINSALSKFRKLIYLILLKTYSKTRRTSRSIMFYKGHQLASRLEINF